MKQAALPVLFCTKHEPGVVENRWCLEIAQGLTERGQKVLISRVANDPELISAPSPDFVSVMLVDSAGVGHFSPYDPRDPIASAGLPPWACCGTWGAKIGSRAVVSRRDLRNCTLALIDIFVRKQKKTSERRYPWGRRSLERMLQNRRPLETVISLERSASGLW